jgi:hypothetical protein
MSEGATVSTAPWWPSCLMYNKGFQSWIRQEPIGKSAIHRTSLARQVVVCRQIGSVTHFPVGWALSARQSGRRFCLSVCLLG